MLLRILFLSLLSLSIANTAFSQRKKRRDEDVLKGADLNDPRRPSLMAKEIGEVGKKQKRAYLKQLRRTKKEMDKRNREKQKNIARSKIRTKRASGSGKGASKGTDGPSETR